MSYSQNQTKVNVYAQSSYSVLDPSPPDGASTFRGLLSQLTQTRYPWDILDPAEMTVLPIMGHFSLPTRRESPLPVRMKKKIQAAPQQG